MAFLKDLLRASRQTRAGPRLLDIAVTKPLNLSKRVEDFESTFSGTRLRSHLLRVLRPEMLRLITVGLLLACIEPAVPLALKRLFEVFASRDHSMVWSIAGVVSLVMLLQMGLRWLNGWYEGLSSMLITQIMTRVLFQRLQLIDIEGLREAGKEPLNYLSKYPNQLSQLVYVIDFHLTNVLLAALIAVMFVSFGFGSIGILLAIAALSLVLQRLIVVIGGVYQRYLATEHSRVGLYETLVSSSQSIVRQRLQHQMRLAIGRARGHQLVVLKERAWWQVLNRTIEDNFNHFVSLAVVGLALLTTQRVTASELLPILVMVGSVLSAVRNNLANYRVLNLSAGVIKELEAFYRSYPAQAKPEPALLKHGEVRLTCPDGRELQIAGGTTMAIVSQDSHHASVLLSRLAGGVWRTEPGQPNAVESAELGGDGVLVQREPTLMEGSILDHVTLWARAVDHPRYEQALFSAGVLDDPLLEHGDGLTLNSRNTNVSEGQAQRLALAQALYSQADVLLLDNFFAPLNPELAARVARRLSALSRTVVFSTTRYEMVHHADQVLVVGPQRVHLIDRQSMLRGSDRAIIEDILGEAYSDLMAALHKTPSLAAEEAGSARAGLTVSKPRTLQEGLEEEVFDTTVQRQFNAGDLWRNAQGMHHPVALVGLVTMVVLTYAAGMAIPGVIERWSAPSNQGLNLLIGLVAAATLGSAVRYALGFRAPIGTVAALHRMATDRVLNRQTEGIPSNRLLGRLTDDLSDLDMSLPNDVTQVLANLVQVVLYSAMLVGSSVYALVPLVPLCAFAVWVYLRGKHNVVAASRLAAAVRGPVMGFVSPALKGLSFRRSDAFRPAIRERFSELVELRTAGLYWSNLTRTGVRLLTSLLSTLVFLSVVWLMAMLIRWDQVMLLAPSLVVFWSYGFSQQVNDVIQNVQNADGLLTQFDRLGEVFGERSLPNATLAAKEQAGDGDRTHPDLSPAPDLSVLEVSHVGFAYPDSPDLLNDVSLVLEPRTHLALVGPSGAGKSTLLKLIDGSLSPHSGFVFVLGDAHVSPMTAERLPMVVVESAVPSLTLTVQDFLDPNHEHPEAKLSDVLATLYGHHDTLLRLGGQFGELGSADRQVANFARVVLRKPRLLLLDESTSNLSPGMERQVLHALRQLLPEMSSLSVLHRTDNLDLFQQVIEIRGATIAKVLQS
jgi:ATP-binding cassette, subfamily B, bacterial